MTVEATFLSIPTDVRGEIFKWLPLKEQGRTAQVCKQMQKEILSFPVHQTVHKALNNVSLRSYTLVSKHNDNQLQPTFSHSTASSRNFSFAKGSIQAKHSYSKDTLTLSKNNKITHTFTKVNDTASFGNYLFIAKEEGLMILDPSTMKSTVLASLTFQRLHTDEKTGRVYGLKDSHYQILDFSSPEAKSHLKDFPFVNGLIKTAEKIKKWGARFIEGFVFGFKTPFRVTNKFIVGGTLAGGMIGMFVVKAITVSLIAAAIQTLIIPLTLIGFYLTLSLTMGVVFGIMNSISPFV